MRTTKKKTTAPKKTKAVKETPIVQAVRELALSAEHIADAINRKNATLNVLYERVLRVTEAYITTARLIQRGATEIEVPEKTE